MLENLNESISVILKSTGEVKTTGPTSVYWRGRVYKIEKIGLHYTYRSGNKLFHVYCVTCASTNFKLIFDTSNLIWSVGEVYDQLSG